MERELSNCTFAKTVLMLLVILGHATSSWGGQWFVTPVYPSVINTAVTAWLGGMHIYAFAVVSGYLFCFKMSGGGYDNFRKFIQTKVKRLLIPYLFAAFIWVIPVSNVFFHYDLRTVVEKFVLCTSPSQLWFLWMLFWVFVFSWLLWRQLSDNGFKGLLTAGILFCIGVIGSMVFPNYFMIWTSLQYIPFFYFGIQICRRNLEGRKARISYVPWWGWVVLYTGLFIIVDNLSLPDALVFDCLSLALSTLLHVFGAFMAIVVLGVLAKHLKWEKSTVFHNLSVSAMGMYLFHQQVVYVTMWLFNGKLPPVLHAIVNFIVAAVVSWGMTTILLKFRFTSFLIGTRQRVKNTKKMGN